LLSTAIMVIRTCLNVMLYVHCLSFGGGGVTQQSKSGLRRLTVELSRLHTIRHNQPVGLLWTRDQLVTEAAIYTEHNKHKSRTAMPSAGFELANSAIKLLQTCASDSMSTGTGKTGIMRPMLYGASGTHLSVSNWSSFKVNKVTWQKEVKDMNSY